MNIVKYRAEYAKMVNDSSAINGDYNIEVGRLDRIEAVGKNVYYKPKGGTVSINYLAIHSKYQGIKIAEYEGKKIYLGDYLLRDCEKRILDLRSHVGISFVTIYSTQQGYHLYHKRNGYVYFEEDMSNFVSESDKTCFKLYKWVDESIE